MSVLFISICNYGYIDMAENLILSMKKNNIENYIIYVLDDKSFTTLHNKGYNTVLYKDINKTNDHIFGTVEFDEITFIRWEIINLLLKEGKTVWFLDIDIVLLDNLNNYIENLKHYEFCIQNDINMMCAGCMLFFPTENTIYLSKLIYENRNTEGIINDQILLNRILENNFNKIKIHILDYNIFPNGLLYFKELDKNPIWRNIQEKFRKNTSNIKLVHANWMVGKNNKIKALKEKNLWYLDYQ